jgi:hypothetical protein
MEKTHGGMNRSVRKNITEEMIHILHSETKNHFKREQTQPTSPASIIATNLQKEQ